MIQSMSTKYPEPEDYGITRKEYDQYIRYELDQPPDFFCAYIASPLAAIALIGFAVYFATRVETGGDWFLVGLFCLFGLVPGLTFVAYTFLRFKSQLYFRSNIPSKIRVYKEGLRSYEMITRAHQSAERVQQRKLNDFWISLSGTRFEQELGNLYSQLGYEVESTPTSGDEGVDIILRKDGKKTVVQCKAHKTPVGPAIVRELYGSMVAYGAENSILACTGGFTRGVRAFAKGKPIELVSINEILILVNKVDKHMEVPKHS